MTGTPVPTNPEPDPMPLDPSNLGSVDPLSVEGLFLVALGKQGTERSKFLTATCHDTDQRQRVEALLGAYENAGSFLQRPVMENTPTPVGEFLTPCSVPGMIGKLGPYEIIEEIGRGGMGVVFRAHDPLLQRIVAVKALAPELARLPSARQRFLREARAAAAISHPHVVTIFAVDGTEAASLGTERTTLPYLVMECIVGQTLHDKIKRVGALKVEEIIRISRQIAEGLAAAHKRGLIHRDIKPANILLENGVERVKVTDFGLARTASDDSITHTGEILGTPQCMSPEQARGENVDTRSDLFSLGCVMYTMCTGVNPFRADNMLAIMKKVCEATPRPIAELNPEVPQWLGQLVHQLLEKSPEVRVQTAAEVVQVLESRSVVGRPAVPVSTADPQEHRSFQLSGGIPPWLPVITALSTMLGIFDGAVLDEYPLNTALLNGAYVWAGIALVCWLTGIRWSWVRWSGFWASMISLGVGGLAGIWFRHSSELFNAHSTRPVTGPENARLVVLFLAIGLLWLLTRLFPRLFIQNTPLRVLGATESGPDLASGKSPAQPRSPWSVLGWILVAMVGASVLSLAVALILPKFAFQQAPERVSISVVQQPQTNTALAPRPRIFSAEDVDIGMGGIGEGMTMSASGTATLPAATATATGPDVSITTDNGGSTTIAGGGSMTITGSEIKVASPAATPSIPLADALEVLTDPQAMPAAGIKDKDNRPITQTVWIDEPGLLIRLKRLDFEGAEQNGEEYYTKVAWGSGAFLLRGDNTENPVELPSGRYRVLIQDLDYGWSLDRRGITTIGASHQCFHVKRSFVGQQLTDTGVYPVAFRWAGKTYQIHTPLEITAVNKLLETVSQGDGQGVIGKDSLEFAALLPFRDPSFMTTAVEIEPHSGGARLRRVRTLMEIDIPSSGMNVLVRAEQFGEMAWNGPFHSTEGVFVPPAKTSAMVSDEMMTWLFSGLVNLMEIDRTQPEKTPFVFRRDRAAVKRFSEDKLQVDDEEGALQWFGDKAYFSESRLPAVRRLIAAWADGQPDVPEAELLALTSATTLEEFWTLPHETLQNLVVPGSTPGTWRIKEPPAGAVVDTVPTPP